jgi:endogenous inhibitor of DNA gyrase (YacG/DUF329 family)
MTTKKTQVKCPTCQKLVLWAETSPYRPFCCERCKLIDLGSWADESYRVSRRGDDDFGIADPQDDKFQN